MTLRKIAQIGEPVLRTPCTIIAPEDIQTPQIQQLIDDLIATMRDANGAGLAANQIYSGLRVCVIEVGDNPRYPYKPKIPLTVLINPVLTPLSEDTFINYEGCLSVPNLRGEVKRRAHIRVQGLDRAGTELDFVMKGISAGTFQHEIDHLDGKLFIDNVTDYTSLVTLDNYTRYRSEQFKAQVKKVVEQWGS